MRAECGVLVVCETGAPIGFAARPPLPSGTWIPLAPGGQLSNPEEELKDGGWGCAGGKMAAASVSAASDSQFSVRGGDRVGSRWACTALRVASLFRRPSIWRQSSSRRMAGRPRPRATPGGCSCVFWGSSPPPFPPCVPLSSQPVLWSVVPSRAGALRPASTKLRQSRERNGRSRKPSLTGRCAGL